MLAKTVQILSFSHLWSLGSFVTWSLEDVLIFVFSPAILDVRRSCRIKSEQISRCHPFCGRTRPIVPYLPPGQPGTCAATFRTTMELNAQFCRHSLRLTLFPKGRMTRNVKLHAADMLPPQRFVFCVWVGIGWISEPNTLLLPANWCWSFPDFNYIR